jgi:cell envelope opacity-associated protein A
MMVMALLVGVAQAEEKKVEKKAMAKRVGGAITAVDATSITVQPGDATKQPVTVPLTDTTKVKVEGKEGKVADLKVGQKVTVVLDAEGKNAVAVNVGPAKPHGEGKK